MKLPQRNIAALSLLCLVSLGASCDRGKAAEPAPAPGASEAQGEPVSSLSDVDLSELTDHELETWQALVNEQLSPCGEPISVGRCAAGAKACRACKPAARYLTRLVQEGYDKPTIEEHYAARFGREGKVELALTAEKVKGSPMAPVTIVEFSDFQCPFCAAAYPELERLVRENQGTVKLVFKHFPLSGHSRALPAARAAEAAALQGKFWEMHDLLFAQQKQLEDADLRRYAQQIGLDVERFERDFASPEVAAAVEADRAEGHKLGLEGTPTVYVNGRKLHEPLRVLPAYIAEELQL
jgi:hypothetical protein